MKVLQRAVWNTAGWRRPTKSSSEAGYPANNGFGHEEWNFAIDDAVDGEVLGYVYWSPSEKAQQRSKGVFDIAFWTLHPETKRRLLVGRYGQARVADDAFLERVAEEFDQRGIFERRAQELQAAVPTMSLKRARQEAHRGIDEGWVRFRCPVGSVVMLEPSAWIELPKRIQEAGLSLRFASPTFVSKFPSFETVKNDNYGRASPLAEDAYFREVGARLMQVLPLHNALSNAFAAWLRREGHANVRQEANRVDIEFGLADNLHRAELKTCQGVGTTKAIREALGQLLEYNHYGIRETAKSWWIVLDREPSGADRDFVKTLRDSRRLPLVLAWQTKLGFEVDHDSSAGS